MSEVVCPFPPPPPFYHLYKTDKPHDHLPPPPPIEGTYQMFGQFYSTSDVMPTLKEQGACQLFSETNLNPILELKKLNRTLLITFLKLLEVLINNPANSQPIVDQISVLCVNMHFLINSYRPHQARQSLIEIMENQKRRRVESTRLLKELMQNVEAGLKTTSVEIEKEVQNMVSKPNFYDSTSKKRKESHENGDIDQVDKFSHTQNLIDNILHLNSSET
eukprot:TRINITY_DN4719_c0_g1_i1.p1 TRINITY_DN4719_c0_g1~~TRINITY_DN4719_c0_g1_i1.p1  ORF type:complete len:219 (-),score=40.31 TRINITY_DN4719_c0_g1_i1:8-664(-)